MSVITLILMLFILVALILAIGLRAGSFNRRALLSYTLAIIGAGLISLPLSVIITWSIIPFWTWAERILNLRLVTHSGPVLSCYVFVFAFTICNIGSVSVLIVRSRLRRTQLSLGINKIKAQQKFD